MLSICSLNFWTSEIACFSLSHFAFIPSNFVFSSAFSFFISSKRFLENSSFSLESAASSISNCIIFLDTSSSSVGIDSISVLIKLQASSIKSIALSGKNLSEIYLFESVAAEISALSAILTPWNTSYLSFSPLKIVIVSSTDGSSTITGWNLLSSAWSFSIYCLYSFKVVAPIQWSSPLASIGFKMFPASIAPSVFPAPTIVWSSSINKIILPSLFFTSWRTAFNLSSNSPLYLAPATKEPISSENIVHSFKLSGTSPLTILKAKPSAIAVLPTPGSPIKHGLFFVFLDKILITFLISSSLPITGSSFWSLAICVKSCPYFFKTLYVSSGLSDVTLVFPLTSDKAFKKSLLFMLWVLKISLILLLQLSKIEIIICSTETYSSFIFLAIFSASVNTLSTSCAT